MNADTIRGWWSRFPDANIALPTGSVSGLFVLDVDPRHGGAESLAALESRFGPFPATLESQTGGGGRHFFFALAEGQVIRNSAGKLGPGLDVRGEGGYVVLPPSIHPEMQKPYAWACKAKPVQAPAWLTETLSARASVSGSHSDAPVPAGQRNDTLARIAGAMRRRGCTQPTIEAALLAENARRCRPPLSDTEVRAISHSVSRYTPETPTAAENRRPETAAVLRCFRDIAPEAVRWLWPKRIPLGKLTLLVGDPGLGKSLVTIHLASCVTSGSAFPDGEKCEAGEVIFLSAEDDPADTIRPRLDAAGANVSRSHILEAVRVTLADGAQTEKAFNLETDLAALEAALRHHPDVRLIVIDPISAYLGGVDSHSNAEVRGILAPLASLAARHGVAVVAVTHLRKSAGAAIHRAIASIAFAAAARAVWAVACDPSDPERRLMLAVKQNLGPNIGGLAFRVETQIDLPHLDWESGAVNMEANDVLNVEDREDHSERAEAEQWLREYLADGPVGAREVIRAAKDVGVTRTTLWRAASSAGVIKRKIGGRGAGWEWSLKGSIGESIKESSPVHSHLDSLTDEMKTKPDTVAKNSKNPPMESIGFLESLPLADGNDGHEDGEIRL
jgi:putative DNA primase/helicase